MNRRESLYLSRFERVIDYIHAHLDEPLDLNQLAEIACLSPYHWHRIYRSVYGETLAATVKRLRLHRAAGMLIESKKPIGQIAQLAGYSSVQAFTRAFSDSFGLPPARYQQNGKYVPYARLLITHTDRSNNMLTVDIKTVESQTCLGVAHQGAYMEIGTAFEKLFYWLGHNKLVDDRTRSYGIYFDDPCSVAPEQLRSAACATVSEVSIETPESIKRYEIAGGDYAVLCHVGPYAELESAYEWLYGHWLPESGREPANQPVFEEYVNDPRQVAPKDLITHIYLPLKPV